MLDFLFQDEPTIDESAWSKVMAFSTSPPMLREVHEAFATAAWEAAVLKAVVEDIGMLHDLKPGKAQAPVRAAVTGRSIGPPLYDSLEFLGRDETRRRLETALRRVEG